MKVSDFNYELPEELIAQTPIEKRDQSRLMVLNKEKQTIEHRTFHNIIDYLEPGDVLVRNNTKVIPARLYGKKETGANVEFLLLNNIEGDIWECIVRPGNKLHVGTKVSFGEGILKAEILEKMNGGSRKVKFEYDGIFNEILDEIGLMPLPPYIHQKLKDQDRYQTVYAEIYGSSAAPTAGLHFTEELLKEIKDKGIEVVHVTLHVGLGTFRPVQVDNILEHKMHKESYILDEKTTEVLNHIQKNGGKIFAVGTTSTRVLESNRQKYKEFTPEVNDTEIFIYPGYEFKGINNLITNFHLPKSTLIMLVSALAGKENIMKAYKEAVSEKYRFFSFGDAMLIID